MEGSLRRNRKGVVQLLLVETNLCSNTEHVIYYSLASCILNIVLVSALLLGSFLFPSPEARLEEERPWEQVVLLFYWLLVYD